jgi:hypothetical protein
MQRRHLKGHALRPVSWRGKLVPPRHRQKKLKREIETAMGPAMAPWRALLDEARPASFNAAVELLREPRERRVSPSMAKTLALLYMRRWAVAPKRGRGRPPKKPVKKVDQGGFLR